VKGQTIWNVRGQPRDKPKQSTDVITYSHQARKYHYVVQIAKGWESVSREELEERCADFELVWTGVGVTCFLSSSPPGDLVGKGTMHLFKFKT
jgi:hypothetical protein